VLSPSLQAAQREYAEAQILSAQPVVIIQMLYEVAIRALEAALVHLQKKEHMERAREVSRAQEAVNELILALDRSVSSGLVPGLGSLYTYVQEQILLGHARQSDKPLREAISILKTLHQGWTGVCQQQKAQYQSAAELPNPVSPVNSPDSPEPPSSGRASAYQEAPENQTRDWNC
jgi:flagellar biosynthetic protein FliS